MSKGFTYKSYVFVDKDPIIDEIRTIYQASGATYDQIHENSGVSTATLTNWFSGTTRRPQAATVNAVLRCLGYKLGVVPFSSGVSFKVERIDRHADSYGQNQAREMTETLIERWLRKPHFTCPHCGRKSWNKSDTRRRDDDTSIANPWASIPGWEATADPPSFQGDGGSSGGGGASGDY